MGSVIDTIECPNCKHDATEDFYYKTGEAYIFCNNCGYSYSSEYKRDDTSGKLITRDGTDNHNFDNLIMETKEIKNPYGAYTIKYYESVGRMCGSLADEAEYQELKSRVGTWDGIEYAKVSRLDSNGEISVETLIDNGPKIDGAGFTYNDN